MNVKVHYLSRGGNTKKIAEAISQAIGQMAEAIPPAYPMENVKLLFLGGGIYGGKLDSKLSYYIGTLNTKMVKNVVLFSTSGSPQGPANKLMKEQLEAKGIKVLEKSFCCPGKFFLFFNIGRPNSADIKKAQEFAKEIMAENQ
ncbi:MAG: flavodoxin domain-containing protein [Clostridia bacterium]|nr:flavodoxin domain-containing protein [Clostridia bacterium]